MMITATKLRNGVTFEENGVPFRVIKYQHTHLSRGSGTVKVSCKNLRTGQLVRKTYGGRDKVEDISVFKKQMQYLYQDTDDFVFMNPDTYEQVTIAGTVLGDDAVYLKEGEKVDVLYWDEEPLTVDLPAKMVFVIAEAAPGEKGDSASNVYKDAKLENGLKVRVPLFINTGDSIRVDTRDGSYIERAN